ncbi:MAG: nicotinate-nucleotide diphosphorylase (carboxylating) [Crocinitomicaceae bacterium]|nr:nicotinate-nucleotide diphosphorylase (carboxylating) [Crocinitomicaceae bacterium]|tara:strand:+ start:6797 stop:7633 length:837 start_codon:yes stop_codon:yes gene_type:complete
MIDIKRHVELSIEEDIKEEDHSGAACIPSSSISQAQLLIKDTGVISGIEVAQLVFKTIDSSIQFKQFLSDGDQIKNGDIAFEVRGSVRNILKAERLALNYMQRMSGIATTTGIYVEAIKGTETKILDTRKTSPGLRSFEKLAVTHGGGFNHRFGLYDMIMIKDNHIDFAGGIDEAMNSTSAYLKANNLNLKVEVEARDLNEVEKILSNGNADRIMFDNFNYSDTQTGVKMVAQRMETESSGGITLETIRGYAECGVDFISVGALTHQIQSLDMSLKAF